MYFSSSIYQILHEEKKEPNLYLYKLYKVFIKNQRIVAMKITRDTYILLTLLVLIVCTY